MADIVYVKDGKEIPSDAWIEYNDPSAGILSCQPMNMTPDQMLLAEVTIASLQPMPDEFYGPVQKDPDNPGHWIQTPYPPDEMQVRLHDHSTSIRMGIENGGMVLAGGSQVTPSTRDVRAMYNTGSVNAAADPTLRLTVKLYQLVDGVLSRTPAFIQMGKTQLDRINRDLTNFAESCFATEANVANLIVAGTITTKEEIEGAYTNVKKLSPTTALPRLI
jgi:hypothetical protein